MKASAYLQTILNRGWASALLAEIYIFAVWAGLTLSATVFKNGSDLMAPIIVLMVLVLSVLAMATFFFCQPLLLYFDNKKSQAVKLFLSSAGYFAIYTIVTLTVLSLISVIVTK